MIISGSNKNKGPSIKLRRSAMIVIGFSLVSLLLAVRPVFAQQSSQNSPFASRDRVIEEVIVTAQRREEQIQDVPISMSALDGGFLREQGITDLEGAAHFIPNVRIDSTGSDIVPNIRGFAANTFVTRGQEQPVGLAIDEIPYGRAEYFQGGLFDLQRVEALRGPQGHLFGANTTVGLLNLTTNNPTEQTAGFILIENGELGRERYEAAIGGPIIQGSIHARIALLSDRRDGFVENTTAQIVPEADRSLGGRDRRGFRSKVDFPNLFGASLLFSYQRDIIRMGGSPRELTFVPERFRSLLLLYDPNVEFELNHVASLDTPGFTKVDIDTFGVRAQYDIGSWGLNAVAGWSELDSSGQNDSDGAPWPAAFLRVDELSRQATFELRVTSPALSGLLGMEELFGLGLGSTDFTSGFFFQRRTQRPTVASTGTDTAAIAAITAVSNIPPGASLPLPDVTDLLGRPPEGARESAFTRFEQESDAYSVFGQMNWHLDERWTVLPGIRLDYTSKDASWAQVVEPDTAVIIGLAFEEFEAEDRRSEFNYAPKVGVKFQWFEDANLYATWSSNFQAAGFNSFAASPDAEARKFDSSRVQSWEAGIKLNFPDQSAQMNIGFFWMDLNDFQLFTTEVADNVLNIPQVRIVNIGELRARGVEIDATWLPTGWLTLRGAIGYNDTELVKFPIGTCFSDRQNTDGGDDPRCDLSGRPFPQAPEWDVSFSPRVHVPLRSLPWLGEILANSFLGEIEVVSALNIQYIDSRFLNDTLDPRTEQSAYTLVNGTFGFRDLGERWALDFTVENLTNEKTGNFASEAAIASGMTFKSPNPPRLAFASFRWNF